MPETRPLLERVMERVELRPFTLEGFHDRRDRKRRNQRITAGVVGIAVFVAAVWIVTTGGVFDRPETPAVTGPTVPPDAGWDGIGLPPEGTELSTPVTGTLIGRAVRHCGFGCTTVTRFGAVFVYADGRVIHYPEGSGYHPITEQRLTPEGVALVQSGAVEPIAFLYPRRPKEKLPAIMWADHTGRPYAPSRYAVCFYGSEGAVDLSRLGRVLPASAETLLRGNERDYRFHGGNECFELTTAETRALNEILSDAYVERPGFSPPALERVMRDDAGNRIWIEFRTLLPHGRAYGGVGG